jgi:hypothetical protein
MTVLYKVILVLVVLLSGLLYGIGNAVEDSPQQVVILVGTADGNLHAIGHDFKKIWTTSTGDPLIYSKFSENESLLSSQRAIPTIDGSIILSGKDGIRKTPLTAQTLTERTPLLTKNGLLLTGRKQNKILGINFGDGTVTHSLDIESPSPKKKTSSSSISTARKIPLWVGRVDYSVNGMDMESGESEFNLSYSEIFPLFEEKSGSSVSSAFPLPQEQEQQHSGQQKGIVSLTDRSGTGKPLQREGNDQNDHDNHDNNSALLTIKNVISTPDGHLLFYGDNEPLHPLPIDLSSPVVNAYTLKLEKGEKLSFHSKIAIHYSLQDLKQFHKITIPSLAGTKPKKLLSGGSASTAATAGPSNQVMSTTKTTTKPNNLLTDTETPEDSTIFIQPAGGVENSLYAIEFLKSQLNDENDDEEQSFELMLPAGETRDEVEIGEDGEGEEAASFPYSLLGGADQKTSKFTRNNKNPVLATKRFKKPFFHSSSSPLPPSAESTSAAGTNSNAVSSALEAPTNEPSAKSIQGLHKMRLGNPLDDSWLLDLVQKQPTDKENEQNIPDQRKNNNNNNNHQETTRALHEVGNLFKNKTVLTERLLIIALVMVLLFVLIAQNNESDNMVMKYFRAKEATPTVTKNVIVTQLSPTTSLELTTAPLSENQENNKIPTGFLTLGSLKVSDRVLGYGSHGTIVFHGELNGRAVAVKRMLSQFHKSIDREIASLIRSDGHPNVVRYFLKEEKNDFVYLGLQLCEMSLK